MSYKFNEINGIIQGGYSSTITPLRISNAQRCSRQRFENIVAPFGLPVISQTETNIYEEKNMDDNEYSSIDNKKFDTLFYSVGKDLGKHIPKNKQNKTAKSHRRNI